MPTPLSLDRLKILLEASPAFRDDLNQQLTRIEQSPHFANTNTLRSVLRRLVSDPTVIAAFLSMQSGRAIVHEIQVRRWRDERERLQGLGFEEAQLPKRLRGKASQGTSASKTAQRIREKLVKYYDFASDIGLTQVAEPTTGLEVHRDEKASSAERLGSAICLRARNARSKRSFPRFESVAARHATHRSSQSLSADLSPVSPNGEQRWPPSLALLCAGFQRTRG